MCVVVWALPRSGLISRLCMYAIVTVSTQPTDGGGLSSSGGTNAGAIAGGI